MLAAQSTTPLLTLQRLNGEFSQIGFTSRLAVEGQLPIAVVPKSAHAAECDDLFESPDLTSNWATDRRRGERHSQNGGRCRTGFPKKTRSTEL